MRDLATRLTSFARNKSGATGVEYGLLIAGIAALVIVSAYLLGDTLTQVLQTAASCVEVGCT